MINEKKTRYWILWGLILITLSLYLTVSCFAQADERNDTELRDKIDEAIRLYPKESNAAHKILKDLGNKAIPRILEIIGDDTYSQYGFIFKKSRLNPFLLFVIEGGSSDVSESALMSLLKGSDNIMRGMAILSLGTKKSKKAIPCIIELLNDTSPYLSYRITDSEKGEDGILNESVSIRDKAIEALQTITKTVLKPKKNKKIQAEAWIWWSKQQNLATCCPSDR